MIDSYGFLAVLLLVFSIPIFFNILTSERMIWELGRDRGIALGMLWTVIALCSIFIIVCIAQVRHSQDSDDNGWNGGGGEDEPPKIPPPGPTHTKELVEQVIRESQEKIKNPSLV